MNKKIIMLSLAALFSNTNADYLLKQTINEEIAANFKIENSDTFNSHTFTNCGITAYYGPTLAQCRAAYKTSWDEDPNKFNITTQGIQEWKVPTTGTYKFTVKGAAGGNNYYNNLLGGKGIIIQANMELQKDTILKIIVGSRGGTYYYTGGGGGASVIYINGETMPLIVAAGGGGAGNSGGAGCNAVLNQNPSYCHVSSYYSSTGQGGGNGGSSGNGGWGTGGAGWNSNGKGAPRVGQHADWGGSDLPVALKSTAIGGTATHGPGYTGTLHDYNGGTNAGAPGGFGGGGTGQQSGGGAGGGYSGGSAGGAGGGSYYDLSRLNTVIGNSWGNNLENGSVIIEKL